MREVFENAESTRRQYVLRERAVALGWPSERITVIDTDPGLSGADRDRAGLQRLIADVGRGRAGIVLGLEMARLARNPTDWHRLLEIYALSETLILDENGLPPDTQGVDAGGARRVASGEVGDVEQDGRRCGAPKCPARPFSVRIGEITHRAGWPAKYVDGVRFEPV